MKKRNFYAAPSDFIESFGFDQRLAPYDLEASAAHAEMLGRRGIIPKTDSRRIVKGLKTLSGRLEKGARLPKAEDVHYAIEQALVKLIGPAGGKVHTARSRNDQTVTALRLYARRHIDLIREALEELIGAFVGQAEKNINAPMPGYTHLQPGQPVSAAHHFLAYAWMFLRDRDRLRDARVRVNALPLGAAALGGTSFPIDREWTAKRLGFETVMENSMDAVADRDFLLETHSALSILMVHLSRWAEELVIWSNPAFGFVTLADPFVSGSSIMPQKRNPDAPELIRGKASRVIGGQAALLALLKAQPLAYNRDLQEDKPPFFEGVDIASSSLAVAAEMARTLRFHADKARAACGQGHLLATDVADALARRGVPFREAHGMVAKAVERAEAERIPLEELPLKAWRSCSPAFGGWLKGVLSLDRSLASRASRGGAAPSSARLQIRKIKAILRKP